MILHSPTEPTSLIRALTRQASTRDNPPEVISSLRTERMGVDFAWNARGRWWGVQRKELHDFLASLDDGRLAKELAQMKAAVTMPVLVLEGRIQIANDIVVTKGYGRPVTLSGLNKRLLSIQSRDVSVVQTSEVATTAHFVLDHYEWSQAEGHATASTRPKPVGGWGTRGSRDYQIHLLTALPGVGEKTAKSILDTLGRCPLTIDATLRELVSVPGVGPVMARRMLAAVNTRENTCDETPAP